MKNPLTCGNAPGQRVFVFRGSLLRIFVAVFVAVEVESRAKDEVGDGRGRQLVHAWDDVRVCLKSEGRGRVTEPLADHLG
jgi:hypothetical protein